MMLILFSATLNCQQDANTMRQLETLLEEYQGELAELEKAYHTFTDVVGNHCNTSLIVSAIHEQIIFLVQKKYDLELEIEAHNAQFAGEKEYDPEY